MSNYGSANWDINEDTAVLREFKNVLRKLELMPNHPFQDLLDALSAGFYTSRSTVEVESLEGMLKTVTFDDKNLKP